MRYEDAKRLHNGDEVCLHPRLSSCRKASDYGVVHRVRHAARGGRRIVILEIFVRAGEETGLIERTHREVS